MEKELTEIEQQFYKFLKKELFFSNIEIRTKTAIKDLCKERNDVVIMFGRDFYLINDIVIDFILCKNGKVIAGIELIDEPEELAYKKGEEMLISTIFARLGYKFFNITDTSKLKESAKTIKREIKN
ncbi:MAG: hypothetical protein IJH00_02215 [Erysipelotrichaceae bacterium]|nr:hypothetical protein [Erysipelotrichaceae bacterium]